MRRRHPPAPEPREDALGGPARHRYWLGASTPAPHVAELQPTQRRLLGSPDTDDPEDARAYARRILPVAEKLAASAPSEVQTDVDLMLATTRAAGESGDLSGFQSPDFATAETRWHSAGLETCDWNTVDVQLADHTFAGLPDTFDAGPTSIEMSNIGSEFHVVAIFRRSGDIDDEILNLLAQPTDDGFAGLLPIASGFAAPGSTGYVLATLTPGEYVALCPIPIGSLTRGVRCVRRASASSLISASFSKMSSFRPSISISRPRPCSP